MSIASDLFRTVTVKINDISQQLPYIIVNQADDNGKIIRFVPMDHGQKVTGFTGARLYYPPRSDHEYGDYVTGVESDGAWDFTIPVGVLSVGRVGCNLAFIDASGETYSRNVVFLVEPAVSGVFEPQDGQQTRLDKIIGTVQTSADTAIETINETADSAVERVNKTASDAVGSIGKAEESINESVTDARESAEAAANSATQAAVSASAAQTSERNAANSATQASQYATAAKQSEDNAAESARDAASSERNAASSAEQAASIVASVSGSVAQAENAAQSASQSATAAAGSASAAGGSAQAAADSANKAGESATAARTSERNAASSAAQASQSATVAAQSASMAQNAVDGFGLEVGTTTTGEPGSDASVEIQKTGTKYTANFTIPRGDKGADGVNENVPLGAASGIVAQATDAYPALPRKVLVHGRTIENLWPNFNESTSVAGITISQDDSGLITLYGTSTSNSEQLVYRRLALDSSGKKFFFISTINTDNKFKIQVSTDKASSYSEASPTTQGITYTPSDDAKVFACYIRWTVPIGETINKKFRVMLVEGDTNPGAFVPSGVHHVEPTKLLAAGKNLLSYPAVDDSKFDGAVTFKNEANGPVKIHVDMATNYQGHYYSGLNIPIPAGTYTISYGDNLVKGLQMAVKFTDGTRSEISSGESISKKTVTFTGPKTITQFYIHLKNDEKMGDFTVYPMLELGSTKSDWEACETVETNLPSDISLTDGDTLTIDRDGTTQIVHAEGEPTVLENVTLPELPAPTFNVYTAGGYIQPTVDVGYERDVNLVLEALEAKIAALQVADKTN